MTRRPLDGTVVVITGASSGIGRATALRCAADGARVVLAARRAEALRSAADACRAAGGEALAVPFDAADERSVQALAEAAIAEFGRIDAWVNNAGAYAVGEFEATPSATFDRLLAVNVAGVVYGSRAALAEFRRNGRGVLVNVSSLIGGLAGPQVSAYATSKWAVRGFSFALREELRDAPGIDVCVVRPASIDTPIFRHAANYSGRALRALTPTYPVEDAAAAIASLLVRPRREIVVGASGRALSLAHALAPAAVDRVFGARAGRNQFAGDRRAPLTDGNAFVPDPEWPTASGGWPTVSRRGPALLPIAGTALAAAVLLRRAS